mmetsp:Transcript_566/g.1764  ORF Transcript_566/g.1764 Transcript_566/m.1764 type:complete len:201 (+) Transcript_566:1176-1778(+)
MRCADRGTLPHANVRPAKYQAVHRPKVRRQGGRPRSPLVCGRRRAGHGACCQARRLGGRWLVQLRAGPAARADAAHGDELGEKLSAARVRRCRPRGRQPHAHAVGDRRRPPANVRWQREAAAECARRPRAAPHAVQGGHCVLGPHSLCTALVPDDPGGLRHFEGCGRLRRAHPCHHRQRRPEPLDVPRPERTRKVVSLPS